MKNSPFSPQTLALLVAAGLLLLALSIILSAFSPPGVSGDAKSNPHSYSTSLIGHAGFYEMLHSLGRPVMRGLGDSVEMAGQAGVVLAIEPKAAVFEGGHGRKLLKSQRLLLVLPKWWGTVDPFDRNWVGAMALMPLTDIQAVAKLVDQEAVVGRHQWPTIWAQNRFGFNPVGQGELQLIKSPKLRPLIGTSEGMLLGEMTVEGRRIMVLSDPDLLSNLGLGRGDNAALMLEVVDELRSWKNNFGGLAPVVFDEVVHDLQMADGSFWQMLFRFPYAIATALAAASALMAALAGSGRFGAPLKPKAELDFGKAQLIANSVRLLDFAGHHGEILKNYIWMVVRMVARDLHAPRGQGDKAVVEWLDRLGRSKGLSRSCTEIIRSASLEAGDPKNVQRLYLCARDIHLWKGEMLNGPQSSRSHR